MRYSRVDQRLKIFRDAQDAMGVPFFFTETMTADIVSAGFQNVKEYGLKAPLGTWPADKRLKEIGSWCELSFDTGLEGWAMHVLTGFLKVSKGPPSRMNH